MNQEGNISMDISISEEVLDEFHWEMRFVHLKEVHDRDVMKFEEQIKMYEELCNSYKQKLSEAIVPAADASPESITFAKVIVSKKQVYNEDVKNIVQNIEYVSSKAYFFIRDSLKFQLPSKTTLRRWRPIKFINSGIDANVIENLRRMTADLSAEKRECILLLDEVSVNRDLTYNLSTDQINGVVDYSKGQRHRQLASKALVFMLKGIFGAWKYVISYYATSDGMKKEQLKEILLENIAVVESLGLIPRVVVFDQGGCNIGTANDFGVNKNNRFFMSSNNNEIFLFFDYCHLLKSARNTLLTNEIRTSEGIVSMLILRAIYDLDLKSLELRMLPKINYSHMFPTDFEKMNVRRAAQLLSHSMAAALRSKRGHAIFEKMEHKLEGTITFVDRFNKIFDLLNSKNLHDKNPIKRGFKRNDNSSTRKYIEDFIKYLDSFEFASKNKVKWLQGFQMTLRGMLDVSDLLFKKYENVSFIMFGRFNQDALENLFFKIRSKGGSNSHPTVNELQYILARLISMKIIQFDYDANKNCEEDGDRMLEWSHAVSEVMEEDETLDNIDGGETRGKEPSNREYLTEEKPLEENIVLEYYTGYTIYKSYIKKLKCDRCLKVAAGSSQTANVFTKEKAFNLNKIVVPSATYMDFSKIIFGLYKQLFFQNYEVGQLKANILRHMRMDESFHHKGTLCKWFNPKDPCCEHREGLLNFYVTVLLYKNTKFLKNRLLDKLKKDKNKQSTHVRKMAKIN